MDVHDVAALIYHYARRRIAAEEHLFDEVGDRLFPADRRRRGGQRQVLDGGNSDGEGCEAGVPLGLPSGKYPPSAIHHVEEIVVIADGFRRAEE